MESSTHGDTTSSDFYESMIPDRFVALMGSAKTHATLSDQPCSIDQAVGAGASRANWRGSLVGP